MAVQFTLLWDLLVVNTNALTLSVGYRQKTVGGAFITTGFTPSNPLAKTVITAKSPSLSNNIIYEFEATTICDTNGPTPNANGIQESIGFACILPTLSHTSTTVTAVLDVTGTDITKAKFTLKKISDDSNAASPIVVNRVGDSIQATVAGLSDINCYWQINLYAVVNGVEVISNTCSPYLADAA